MRYYKGWTNNAYEEACVDRKTYRVSRDFMLVPEILLVPETNMYYSEKLGLAWVEGAGLADDQIAPLTKDQINQMIEEGVFNKDDSEDN